MVEAVGEVAVGEAEEVSGGGGEAFADGVAFACVLLEGEEAEVVPVFFAKAVVDVFGGMVFGTVIDEDELHVGPLARKSEDSIESAVDFSLFVVDREDERKFEHAGF